MLLSSVITASLYGRREFWVAEARDMKSRRTIEPVSFSLSRGDVRYGNGFYSLKEEATDGDLWKTVCVRSGQPCLLHRQVYDAAADDDK